MQPKVSVEEVSQAVKAALAGLYGERLERVILYGSYARGDFHEESDIDFLVVLRDENVRVGREIRAMGPVIFPVQLHFGVYLSTHPMSLKQFQESGFSFVENVRREGVLI